MDLILSGYKLKQRLVTVKDAAGIVWKEQEEFGEKSVTKSSGDLFEDLGDGPLGTAMVLWDVWKRIPPRQRKQILKQARKHGPTVARTVIKVRRGLK